MERFEADPVYVIERGPMALNELTERLRSMRLTIKSFHSEEPFFAEFMATSPGCLLADIQSLKQSPLDLLAELQAMKSALAVVLTTVSITTADAVRMMKAKAFTVLQKPFEIAELETTVVEALKQSRADWSTGYEWSSSLKTLSEREREVVDLLLSGKSTKQIGQALQISTSTAHKHRSRVFSKLRVDSPTDLLLKSAHFSALRTQRV